MPKAIHSQVVTHVIKAQPKLKQAQVVPHVVKAKGKPIHTAIHSQVVVNTLVAA